DWGSQLHVKTPSASSLHKYVSNFLVSIVVTHELTHKFILLLTFHVIDYG
ncbi:hypothetical protein C8R34_12841, partial [Nitrosomonas sp. Nm84]